MRLRHLLVRPAVENLHLLKSLNRMNDLVEGCKITGKVTLDGEDIYGDMDVNLLRKRVGNGISETESVSDECI